jgi:hypothetical protein
MHFSLIRLADRPVEGEEVYLVVPDGSRIAIAVPLDALPDFLPILDEARSGLSAALPGLLGEAAGHHPRSGVAIRAGRLEAARCRPIALAW